MKNFLDNSEAAYMLWDENVASYFLCFWSVLFILQTFIKEMSHHVNVLDTYRNMDDSGNVVVPLERFDEIKRRYVK